MRKITLVVLPMLAALTCAAAYAAPELDKPAPTLIVNELDGQQFNLADQHGHVVIIDIWATWCAPCRQEMPILNAFYQQYRDKGVVVLALSDDRPRDIADVRKVMQQFTFPAALLAEAAQSDFGRPRLVPITYVFDKNGILRARLWPGGTPVTEQNLEAAVKPLL
jgi:thiol-disulfide isomerase/thioredoxin